MKKITLKLLVFSALVFTTLVSAQREAQRNTQHLNVELNEYNQRFYEETGVVKCLTEEMNQLYRQNNSNRMSNQAFEDWITPLVEEYKQNVAAQRAAGTYVQATYEIPIIFHVIYNNETVGNGPNLSQALINAQIDQLNIDFANQAGALSGPWASVSADSDIQFVPAAVDPTGAPLPEPGINRVGGYATPLDFDGVIKPATIWDRTQYANIWTGELGGGLLGYAQFPDNSTLPGMPGGAGGAANTDGVVCTYTSIGSVAMPHPSGGQFARGRTLTHEIGHWIGLRHIWGDTDCTGDDFCADTPLQDGPNSGGCANRNSCGTVTVPLDRDMSENYMDYSGDTCMDIFTADQVARMIVVLQNSPGRTELPNSTTGNAGPAISFASTTISQNEGSDCSFTDVDVNVVIGAGASANASANFSVTSGTATNVADYEILTPSVSFAAGATTTQTFTLRINNDSFVEGNETFVVNFSVNANGGDATAGNDTLTVTILDDDTVPGTTEVVTLFEDGFETYNDFEISNVGQWTMIDNDGLPTWDSTATDFTNETYTGSFIVFNPSQTTPASGAGWDAHTGDKGFYCFSANTNPWNDDYIITPALNVSTGSEIKFWAKGLTDNYNGGERFRVLVGNAPSVAALTTELTPAPYAQPTLDWAEYTYTIPAGFDNSTIYASINVVTEDEFVFMIDDFSVTTTVDTGVQTAVNTGTQDQVSLLGTGVAYTKDTASNTLMADVNITDTSNYGCTTVSVSRAGNSAQSFQGSIAPALVADKTFTVTPTTDNVAGTSTISFYFTEAELAGWEAATGDNRSNLRIGKDNGSTVVDVASTITAFGSNWKVTGDFTNGIDGTYYFGNLAFLSTSDFKFDAFAMYPNPANNQVTIKFNTTNDVTIDLFDINGRTVLNKTFITQSSSFNQDINVSPLANGIYIVKIKSGDNTMFRKLVVN